MGKPQLVTFPVEPYHTFQRCQMWADQRPRLLREDWPTATDLAQELYAMDLDAEVRGENVGAGITTNGRKPAVTTNNYVDGDTIFQINRRDGTPYNISVRGGELFIGEDPAVKTGGGARSVATSFPGNLTGYSGANVYTVTIYPNGLSGGTQSVSVTQLGGDPSVPHATDGSVWTTVTKTGPDYTMSLPVWQ